MNIDEAVHEAFARDVLAVHDRLPDALDVSRACDSNRIRLGRSTSLRFMDVLTALAMAAAIFLAVHLDPVRMLAFRPLASELVQSIPEGAGSRFLDFMLEAGESYRAMK